MGDISDLTERIVAFRDERNWQQFHNSKDLALSLVLEAAEVIEHFQWRTEAEMRVYLKTHKDDLADELIDVLYWVLLMAHDLDIDLLKSFERKMTKNAAKYPIAKATANHKKYTEL
jgi:dCTP diphosphatase